MTDPADDPGRDRATGVDDPTPRQEYEDEPEEHAPAGFEPGTCSRCNTENVAVSGDEEPLCNACISAHQVAEAGILTEQQALAYILRDVLGVDRTQAANRLGVSKNRHDNLIRSARTKVDQARSTIEALHGLKWPTPKLAQVDADGE